MLSREKPLFDWNQTFRAPNLASRESNKQENLTQFIQKVAPKGVQTEFAVLHVFERETTFWLKSNLQSSKSGISRIEWTRSFHTIHSKSCSKSCSNWICSVSCFRERNHFLTEIRPSELQIWHLKNRMNNKIWHNSNKNLLQKLFKLILQCFMLPKDKPLFDWNQTYRAPTWHFENQMEKKIRHNSSDIYSKNCSNWHLLKKLFDWKQSFRAQI